MRWLTVLIWTFKTESSVTSLDVLLLDFLMSKLNGVVLNVR